MKRIPVFFLAAAILLACSGIVSAQAMAEGALGAGRAATSTAPMSGLGKSIGDALNGLGNTLNKTDSSSDLRTAVPVKTASAVPAVAVVQVHYDDPRQIESGLPYDELVRRFGPATLEITTSPVAKTLSYVNREGAVQVEVREGRVTSMTTAETMRR